MSLASDIGIAAVTLAACAGVSLGGGALVFDQAVTRMATLEATADARVAAVELQADATPTPRPTAIPVAPTPAPPATTGSPTPDDGGETGGTTGPAEGTSTGPGVDTPEEPEPKPKPKPSHPLLGNWRCTFTNGGFTYSPMRCSIRRKGGGFYLEKHAGSQRIKGTLDVQGDTMKFRGTYFCPFGSCTAPAAGTFKRKSKNHWRGSLTHEGRQTIVSLKRSGR